MKLEDIPNSYEVVQGLAAKALPWFQALRIGWAGQTEPTVEHISDLITELAEPIVEGKHEAGETGCIRVELHDHGCGDKELGVYLAIGGFWLPPDPQEEDE